MRKNIELPQGKRTKFYRFLEIIPGMVSYLAIILLFVFSFIDPILGATYLFFIISVTLVKAVAVAYRTIQGYNVVHLKANRRLKMSWLNR